MAFKMKGFDPGKGTGMSPKTMKKGSSMKMKKGSSMKKPLVGDQHKLPQELKAAIKSAPMKLGMRDPNMAMKASNNMLPGSMMAMKANRSAMTLKKGGSVSGAKSMKDKVAAGQDKPTFKTKSKISVGTKESAKRISTRATGKTVDPNTKRGRGAKFDIKKAAAEKAKQKKLDRMPSPMKLKEGMATGAAMAGGAAGKRKLTGDQYNKFVAGGRKIDKTMRDPNMAKRKPLSGDPEKFAQRMKNMKKRSVNTGAAEGAAEAASEKLGGKMEMRREVRKKVSPNKMGHSPKKMKKESAMNMKKGSAMKLKDKDVGQRMKEARAQGKKMVEAKRKNAPKLRRPERTKKPLRDFKIGEDPQGNKFISRRRG